MRISRTDRSMLAEWWFTVDRPVLAAILALIAIGLLLSPAASPVVALKKGLPAFYFVERHGAYAALGLLVMLAVSMMGPRTIRRLAAALFFGGLAVMILVLLTGEEINGARRWLRFAGLSLQPSELAKPGFAVLSAWAFAESARRTDMPALALAIAFYVAFAALLMLQPDVGQVLLITALWGALLFLSGRSIAWSVGLFAAGAGLLAGAYHVLPHVRQRIDRFLVPPTGETSQTDRAFQSFLEGGLFGRGPGEGTIKNILPDARTDFIFAVVAEEYGVLACLILVAIFAYVVLRALARTFGEPDPFTRHGVTALALLLGLQAVMNMAVNVGLVPAKGITLPFISAGGSSHLAMCIACGMLLALTRRRPDPERLQMPGLTVKARRLRSYGTGAP
ncbi:MAG TPA: putative peptidoglycan glycosyltransferase FtsW [Hyphomicrobiaceae bacterium]|nr:putative peptidoglycan glycosyltransferase FtsW [Hyphomicrobiaceae bacterium]